MNLREITIAQPEGEEGSQNLPAPEASEVNTAYRFQIAKPNPEEGEPHPTDVVWTVYSRFGETHYRLVTIPYEYELDIDPAKVNQFLSLFSLETTYPNKSLKLEIVQPAQASYGMIYVFINKRQASVYNQINYSDTANLGHGITLCFDQQEAQRLLSDAELSHLMSRVAVTVTQNGAHLVFLNPNTAEPQVDTDSKITFTNTTHFRNILNSGAVREA